MQFGTIVARGFRASHAALVMGLYFFLLFAPTQLVGAISQSLTPRLMVAPGQPPDLQLAMLLVPLGCVNWMFLFALIFLSPLLIGGAIGRIRDRIEPVNRPTASLDSYGRIFYGRLLGSLGLLIACAIVAMLPAMCIGFATAMQLMADTMRTGQTDPAQIQQMTRQLYTQPLFLTLMVLSTLAMTALALVFNLANVIVVCDGERVIAAWSKSLRFCRANFSAVFGLGLINIGLGIPATAQGVVSGLLLIGQLPVLLALALFQSAYISYMFVLGIGLSTSLYLARRPAAPGTVTLGPRIEPGPGPFINPSENPYRQPESDG